MRLSLLQVVWAGVGLALLEQVAASPIRVVVVTTHQEVSSNVFGRPTEDPSMPAVAHFVPPEWMTSTTEVRPIENNDGAGRRHRLCGKFKGKALDVSNQFRKIFGFPIIEELHPEPLPIPVPAPFPEDTYHILPMKGTPLPVSGGAHVVEPEPFDGAVHHHHPHHKFHHHPHGGFAHRLHRAIMTLGVWEGRAVAFVLGCGIGVLLRMVWVLTVLSFRLIRGKNGSRSEEEYYYDGINEEVIYPVVIFDGSAENLVLPPPEYTDEKVALAQTETPTEN